VSRFGLQPSSKSEILIFLSFKSIDRVQDQAAGGRRSVIAVVGGAEAVQHLLLAACKQGNCFSQKAENYRENCNEEDQSSLALHDESFLRLCSFFGP
jgi:hypothetical protein